MFYAKFICIKDGISFYKINRKFAFFGLSSRDGKAIKESDELIFTFVSASHNTGYKFNPSKIRHSVLGMIDGVEDRGKSPVIVNRIEADITIPKGEKILERYNFAGYCYRTEK